MGSTSDPENGAAVAATVFGAVAVYGVSRPRPLPAPQMIDWQHEVNLLMLASTAGFPCVLF
jgi:hypothetical protein